MTIEELIQKDSTFNQSLFLSKANYMLKRLYNSVTINDLDSVRYYLSEEVYNRFLEKMKEAEEQNQKLIYAEVNVNCELKDIFEDESSYNICVLATVKYLKYSVSLKDGSIMKGDSNNRKTIIHNIVFQKKKAFLNTSVHRCLGCGATFDIHENGVCPHCGRVFDLEEFDYILKSYLTDY